MGKKTPFRKICRFACFVQKRVFFENSIFYCRFEAAGVEWTPMFPGEKYSTYAVGVEVVLAGKESSLTHLRIKKGEEKHAGTGWAFLKEMAGERTFKGCEAMFVVKFRAWKAVVNGVTKAGLKLVATQLAIKAPERKFVDVLPDW